MVLRKRSKSSRTTVNYNVSIRSVRLLGMSDEVEGLEAEDRKRIRDSEAMQRWRERNPAKVVENNAAQYQKHRKRRLAEKKRARNGPRREEILEGHRTANRKYAEKHRKDINAKRRAHYARTRKVKKRRLTVKKED
jgi:hypothetical protein